MQLHRRRFLRLLAGGIALPAVLRSAQGREALGIPRGERVLGLLHFGAPEREPAARERDPVGRYIQFLD